MQSYLHFFHILAKESQNYVLWLQGWHSRLPVPGGGVQVAAGDAALVARQGVQALSQGVPVGA